ncbi:transposase [Phormidium sp. LEGE 05292]|uniref:transposase n=1 Tax=[Phormidium] sp. LEGE 05292 TaxID=767427 RepID=UPI001880CA9B|nr:transposase [Phormidium sp. LEGE 05292]MBE9226591.1 transposase [Phormidium sp. LEGE 05292]
MKYDPAKHHRRSIRLRGYDYSLAGAYFITICTWQRECLFGQIINGEMQLSHWGEIVNSHWQNLPKFHPNLELDEFVIMPNHLHSIIVLINNNSVGAGLADMSERKQITSRQNPPFPVPQKQQNCKNLPEILRGFKTFSARRINQMRRNCGVPVWQRNYYEHIIRNDESLQHIRQYIINNPLTWELDQLHPNSPSKW